MIEKMKTARKITEWSPAMEWDPNDVKKYMDKWGVKEFK